MHQRVKLTKQTQLCINSHSSHHHDLHLHLEYSPRGQTIIIFNVLIIKKNIVIILIFFTRLILCWTCSTSSINKIRITSSSPWKIASLKCLGCTRSYIHRTPKPFLKITNPLISPFQVLKCKWIKFSSKLTPLFESWFYLSWFYLSVILDIHQVI